MSAFFLRGVSSSQEKRGLGSEAEWGVNRDLRRLKLLFGRSPGRLGGIALGSTPSGHALSYRGTGHILISSPTQTYKTQTTIIPTLLGYESSALVLDPKAQLFDITSRHRSGHGEAMFFDPTRADSCCINPFDNVRYGQVHEVGDIQNVLSALLAGDEPDSSAADFYQQNERALILGMALHLVHDEDERPTFGKLRRMRIGMDVTLRKMRASKHDRVKEIGDEFDSHAKETQKKILSSITASLALWSDPLVCEKTSRSDFLVSDLVAGDRPLTVYLQRRESDGDRLSPLMAMLMLQFVNQLIGDKYLAPDGRKKQRPLLLVLEEFAHGGYASVARHLKIMVECGVHAVMITQGLKALWDKYGRDNTIIGDCAVAIGGANLDEEEQRFWSRACGMRKEAVLRRTEDAHGLFKWHDAKVSHSEHKTPLLDQTSFRGLPIDRPVMIVRNSTKPFLIRWKPWYEHPLYRKLGTNLVKGDTPPGQCPRVLDGAQVGVSMADGETPLARLKARMGWHDEQIARELFGDEVALQTVRQWISGSKRLPRQRLDQVDRFMASL